MQGFLTEIPLIPPVSGAAAGAIVGILIPSIVALGGALAAILASLGAAIAGLGALGVAAALAFGPVLGLALGAAVGLAKATQAQKAYEAAQEQVKSASEGLANAEQAQGQAVDALRQARETAAEQIRNDLLQAVDGLRSAEDRLTDANYRAKQAEEDLTEARHAARRAIIDEQLAAANAALSHRGAILAERRARQELRRVQADPEASRLDVAEARLRVAQAEQDVIDTRIASRRASLDANEAEREGVKNAPEVIDARHAVAEANAEVIEAARAVGDAEHTLRRAQAATVEQSPSVISARQAVESANRQAAQAAQALAQAQSKANKALGDLKGSRAALAVVEVAKRIGRAFGPALDPIFRGITRGLRTLLPLIRSLRGPLRTLGQAMGRAFAGLARELARPAWQRFFTMLLRSSAELVRVGSRGFILLLRILRNIAEAALPYLIRGLRTFNHWLAQVARGSKNIDLSGVMEQLGLWLDLTYQLGRVFLAFIRAATGEGGGLVKWLADGARALADWLGSVEGQERLNQFFRDVLPLAKDLVTLFLQLALVVIQLGQLLAPVLDPFVRGLILIARGLNFVLGLLNKIGAPLRSIILLGPVIGGISLVIGNLGGALRFVGRIAATVARGIANAWRGLRDIASRVWEGIKDAITAPIRAVRRIAGNVWDAIRGAAVDAWRALGRAAGRLWGFIKDQITAEIRGVRNVLDAVWGALSGIARRAWRAVLGVVRSIGGRIGDVAERIWHGVVDAARFVGRIPGIVRRALQRAFRTIKGLVDDFVEIGKDLMKGLAEGIKDGAKGVLDAAKGVAEDIVTAPLSPLGIGSPSRVFRRYGGNLMEGFRDGIRAGLRLVRDASREAIQETKDVFQRGVEGIIDAFARLPHGLSRTTSQIGRLLRSLASVVRRAANFVMQAVRKLTSGLGSHLHLPRLELELPDLSPRGFARGGVSRERHYEVSEEGPQYPEIILATNPRYRPRNLGLWATAGRMLGVPGFAEGGIAGVPGYPGERASTRVMGALLSFIRRFKLFLTDAFGPGHASAEHTQYGTAADFVPGPGGSWELVDRAARAAVQSGFTPVGWTGAGGTEAWSGHGPPSVAGGNAHLHVTFLTVAEYLAGKIAGAVSGAVAALIPKIGVTGEGPVASAARAAVETMRDAGNAFIERHQPTATAELGEIVGGKGPVAQVAARVARALSAPHRAVLALFEALWAESGMGSTSSNVLQLLPSTAAGTGIGMRDVAAQVQGFLTRGYYGKGGAIELAQTTNWPAHVIAQAVQGSAFASGSNYAAQKAAALATLRELGYRGFALGGPLTKTMLALIGAETGASELALLPTGTQIVPADLTARLNKALLGTPGQAPVGLFDGAAAGRAGRREPTVQNFNVTTVDGGPPDPVALLSKIGVLARQRGDI